MIAANVLLFRTLRRLIAKKKKDFPPRLVKNLIDGYATFFFPLESKLYENASIFCKNYANGSKMSPKYATFSSDERKLRNFGKFFLEKLRIRHKISGRKKP